MKADAWQKEWQKCLSLDSYCCPGSQAKGLLHPSEELPSLDEASLESRAAQVSDQPRTPTRVPSCSPRVPRSKKRDHSAEWLQGVFDHLRAEHSIPKRGSGTAIRRIEPPSRKASQRQAALKRKLKCRQAYCEVRERAHAAELGSGGCRLPGWRWGSFRSGHGPGSRAGRDRAGGCRLSAHL